jgi:hypothetical protein
MATIFTKQELQDFESLRKQMGDTAILDEVANRNPKKKTLLDSLRQGGVDDNEIANEFLKRKSAWKMTDQAWGAISPQVQQSYKKNYNIEIVPVQKQEAMPTQPEEKPSMSQWATKAIIEPIVKGEQAGVRTSQKLRAGYLKTMGVIPSVTKLENKVFVEKDRAWLGDMANKGKLPPDADIISKLGEDRGNKLIAEINRLSSNLRKPEATRRARGEMGTQYATGFFGTVGEEIMNAIEQLTGPEQVFQPSQLAINLAGIGIGGKVATVTMDNAIKKGLTDAVKTKTMTPESAKQVFTAYKYYAQNTPAETIQAILRGDIPAPKVPGMLKQGEIITPRNPNMEQEIKSQLPKQEQNLEEGVVRPSPQYMDEGLRAKSIEAENAIRTKALLDKQLEEQRLQVIQEANKPIPIPAKIKKQIEQIKAKANADLVTKYNEMQATEAQRGADKAISQLGADWVRRLNTVLSKKSSATN